ncbi:MAG: glycosyltransferase family 2 protein [Nanoarchaeota archaeon]
MQKKLSISVVVCTRNRKAYLKKCLASLLCQSYPAKEIIVVDDSSTGEENTIDYFEKEFSDLFMNLKSLFFTKTKLVILRNQQHAGIVKSRNLGIKTASSDIIAFLDDDCYAHRHWLHHLAKQYSNEEVVGVGGPVVEVGRKVKFLARPVRRPACVRNGHIYHHYKIRNYSDRKYLTRRSVPFLVGGNMSFRRKVLYAVKGFDKNFNGNAYREETDVCYTLMRKGKLICEPDAVTYHNTAKKGGCRDIVRYNLNTFFYYFFRNTTYFFFKHFGVKAALEFTLSLFKRHKNLVKNNKTGLNRDYLKMRNRRILPFFFILGMLKGFFSWLLMRKKEIRFVCSKPADVKVYQLLIVGSTLKLIELENRTHVLKKLLGL